MVVLGGDGTPDCWLLDTHRKAWTEVHLLKSILNCKALLLTNLMKRCLTSEIHTVIKLMLK